MGPTSAADLTWDELASGDAELADWCRQRWLGSWKRIEPPPDDFEKTRRSLHVLAEHVIAPARHRSNGKIGLRYTRAGFGTPFFGEDEQVRMDGREIVRLRGADEWRSDVTTVREVGRLVGIECGAPAGVYTPRTELDPDANLYLDPTSAVYLGDIYGFATSVLEDLKVRTTAEERASRVQIWPEHFDVAIEIGDETKGQRAGYGLSPGDDDHSDPYLYVVPWTDRPKDPWWNATHFDGARCDLGELLRSEDQRSTALDFFEEGRNRLRRR